MNQHALNRAVARATGENVSEIRRRGFGLMTLCAAASPDPDPGELARYLDWDDVARDRHVSVLPDPRRVSRAA